MIDIKLIKKNSENWIRLYEEKAPSVGNMELKEAFGNNVDVRINTIFAPYKKDDPVAQELIRCSVSNFENKGYYIDLNYKQN